MKPTILSLAAILPLCASLASAGDSLTKRGAYLARVMDCAGCHMPRDATGMPIASAGLSGGTVGFEIPGMGIFWPPNLTPDASGLGGWSKDQIATAQWLASQSYVDGARIGIWGWSYGGYMSSLCITKGADVFKAADPDASLASWAVRYAANARASRCASSGATSHARPTWCKPVAICPTWPTPASTRPINGCTSATAPSSARRPAHAAARHSTWSSSAWASSVQWS